MEWMLMPLRRYADFSGRSRRKEFWMFALMQTGIAFLLYLPLFSITVAPESAAALLAVTVPALIIFCLAMFVPSLAVQVRRYHDLDKPGWMVLLAFIPFVGGFIALYFMCQPGTVGPNSYGPDPKAGEHGLRGVGA